MAWAFQKESELLPIFNYHLEKLQQTGVMERLRQKMMQYPVGNTDASNIQVQDSNGLGYEHVAFPFLALLFGLCLAFMQLGAETAITCKKQHSANEEIESTAEKAKYIMNEI